MHERLLGLHGPLALAPGLSIEHRNRLNRDHAAIAAKLEAYDAASRGALKHRLSPEYPRLPLNLFPPPSLTLLRLP